MNLLQDLQERLGLTYLFISHGLPVVRHIANRVGIMYAGKLVEMAGADEIFRNPLHPYTRLLMSAVPIPDPEHKNAHPVERTSQVDSTLPEVGCRFYPRCPLRRGECLETEPQMTELSPGHFVACFAVASGDKKE